MEFDGWVVSAMFISYVVKGLCGFANTLVLTSILSFHTNNAAISPLDLAVGYPANVFMMWRFRRCIRWRDAALLSALVVAAAVPGALLLKNGDVRLLKVLFGVMVTALGLQMLLDRGNAGKKPRRGALLAVGVAAGLMVGLFGVGALLAAYVGRVARDTHEFKGTISVVFFAENTFRIALYTATGLLTGHVLRTAILCLPVMAAGLAVGMLLARRVDERAAKRIVQVFLVLSGLSLMITNLITLL